VHRANKETGTRGIGNVIAVTMSRLFGTESPFKDHEIRLAIPRLGSRSRDVHGVMIDASFWMSLKRQ
jgi:hypothetical protein